MNIQKAIFKILLIYLLQQMISQLKNFQNIFNNHQISFLKQSMNKIIQKYKCYLVIDSINDLKEIEKLPCEPKNIMIGKIDENNSQYFVICFDQLMIIISASHMHLFYNFLKQKKDFSILISNDVKEALSAHNFEINLVDNIIEYESQNYFNEDAIYNISDSFIPRSQNNEYFIKMWKLILPTFSKFFFHTIYTNHSHNKFKETQIDFSEIDEDKIIRLQGIGSTNSSRIELIYHIEKEQLFVLKFFYNFSESNKLFRREFSNYKKVNHPSIPRFYGKGQIDGNICLIIEYIKGMSLCSINKMSLSIEEKINLIFEIMSIIEYFQNQHLIYRDLKPSNFIIDEYKRLILIDFDRMIGIDEQNRENATMDLNNIYQAPELLDGSFTNYSYKEDVYSLGLLIYFILFEKEPQLMKDEKTNKVIFPFHELPQELCKLCDICQKCTFQEPEKRSTITEIIDYFYFEFIPSIEKKIISFDLTKVIQQFNENHFFPYWSLFYEYENSDFKKQLDKFYEQITIDSNAKKFIEQYSYQLNINHLIGQFSVIWHYSDDFIIDNINKFIHYFTISSDRNNPLAQFNLGLIYTEIPVKRDINKAIHYYELAAKQNHAIAQNNLGMIYYEGKYIKPDINKAIQYFTLAASQNILNSFYNLGYIYSDNNSIELNINKAIYYYTLAADQNHAASQSDLGLIYCEGKYVPRDMEKAIHYLTLAANQNLENAQYNLGIIFTEGRYISRDIEKGIYYLQLASDRNQADAQNILGFIYSEGSYVPVDIKKAIHYYTLAANQNHVLAQNNLGIIYSRNKYTLIDMEKAIYYFTLAAKRNHVNAQYNLGIIYFNNIYVPQDINKAIYYLTFAADQNCADAQNILGRIYAEGDYVSRDINKGIYYLTLAANQNHTDAQNNLGFIYSQRKYLSYDIKKAIHYFTLAANQNHVEAQSSLGFIYSNKKYFSLDINKAIHFLKLAADQNHVIAQNNLGYIYSEGEYIQPDMSKAIYYFTLAAKQNYASAQNNLGYIYFEGKGVERDINKAIYYFTLAANQNRVKAQFSLGIIYLLGQYIPQDFNKVIYYLSMAANQNHADSQFILGFVYFNPIYFHPNVKKGLYYIKMASVNRCVYAHFHVGFLYHEGKYEKQDINEAIHFYKEGSSFNSQYSKNNLGIIYKNGFGEEIAPNLGLAIAYFEEAIKQKEDEVSMFNLASIYIYEDIIQKIDTAIDLLINSSILGFKFSNDLLCIAVIKKVGFNISDIRNELNNHKNITEFLKEKTIIKIQNEMLYLEMYFNEKYNFYRDIDYLYDFSLFYIKSNKIKTQNANNLRHPISISPISSEFYKGFEI